MTQLKFLPEPFSRPESDILTRWLGHEGASLACRHLRAKAARLMIESVNELHEAEPDQQNKIESSKAKLVEARRLETFMEVLAELQNGKTFETLTVTYE